jgi:hypothetical protein
MAQSGIKPEQNGSQTPKKDYVIQLLTYLLTYVLTYLHTPRGRVLLKKLNGSQIVKKFLAFYRTLRFITARTSARLLSLSWARTIQSMPPHPAYWRSNLRLSSHLRLGLPSGLYPSGIPNKTLYTTPLFPHTCYMPRPSHSFRFDHPKNFGVSKLAAYKEVQVASVQKYRCSSFL